MANPPGTQLVTRPLFGGAIDLDLPADYIDARQIPDNQEVFLSSTSETSVVLEVLALVEEGRASTDLWEAVKFHFSSIAHDNASLSSTILTPPPSHPTPSEPASPIGENPYTPPPIFLTGTQVIHKFSHNPTGAPRSGHENDEPDTVFIGVALWRCWVEGTVSEGIRRKKKADLVLSVNVNLSAPGGEEEQKRVEEWWVHAIGSLRIENWDLFGDVEVEDVVSRNENV